MEPAQEPDQALAVVAGDHLSDLGQISQHGEAPTDEVERVDVHRLPVLQGDGGGDGTEEGRLAGTARPDGQHTFAPRQVELGRTAPLVLGVVDLAEDNDSVRDRLRRHERAQVEHRGQGVEPRSVRCRNAEPGSGEGRDPDDPLEGVSVRGQRERRGECAAGGGGLLPPRLPIFYRIFYRMDRHRARRGATRHPAWERKRRSAGTRGYPATQGVIALGSLITRRS